MDTRLSTKNVEKHYFIEQGFTIGTALLLFERLIGIGLLPFGLFFLSFLADWITGIHAARARGEPITSRKLGRVLFRFLIYTLVLMFLHVASIEIKWPDLFGIAKLNLPYLAYWYTLMIVLMQQVYSILENGRDCGDKSAITMLNFFSTVLDGPWKRLWDSLDSKKKSNRTKGKP